jgi:hypothetical protein
VRGDGGWYPVEDAATGEAGYVAARSLKRVGRSVATAVNGWAYQMPAPLATPNTGAGVVAGCAHALQLRPAQRLSGNGDRAQRRLSRGNKGGEFVGTPTLVGDLTESCGSMPG